MGAATRQQGQLTEEIDRGADGAVNEGREILETHAIPDPLGAACDDTDALRIRGSVHDSDDFAALLIPRVGDVRQPIAFGGGEEARGVDPDREHVAVPAGHPEVDVQPPRMGIRDEEVFAVVLAAKIPPPAGAQVAFDEVGRQWLTHELTQWPSHGINAEVSAQGDPWSRAKRDRRIC